MIFNYFVSKMSTFRERIAQEQGKPVIKFDTPIPQPLYQFSKGAWMPVSTSSQANQPPQQTEVSRIRLTTWNIDFSAPAGRERMAGALEYLSQFHKDGEEEENNNPPSIIFFQEMTETDLQQIQSTPWIWDLFFITDLSDKYWMGFYGTTTLVDKRLSVQRVFRVLYSTSRMQRDGLFVDVDVGKGRVVRLCNSHLESLTSNPPRRPLQLKLVSEYMHGSGPHSFPPSSSPATKPLPAPHAALIAGDLNAFAPEDLTAPLDCGLTDAFLVLGGQDGSPESFTWGQQAPDWLRVKHGCSRMDKVLFCGGLEAEGVRRVGEGERVWVEYPVESDENEEDEEEKGEYVWVSDHLGVQAVLRVI